ncbi:MAG: hypothetical protein IJ711_12835, partial [Lachnospiraceae bacterium]|nr:hypothetical protein [Lachnospiraceae bacterium]
MTMSNPDYFGLPGADAVAALANDLFGQLGDASGAVAPPQPTASAAVGYTQPVTGQGIDYSDLDKIFGYSAQTAARQTAKQPIGYAPVVVSQSQAQEQNT